MPDTSTIPAHRYNTALADAIETKWQGEWAQRGTFKQPNPGEPGFDASKPKFYCLDMFPYPSGAGLHVGHPEGYTATDIICRHKRMTGHNVLHPMGWDAFGLPAEQYAIQTGVHPAQTTKTAIDNFRRQLQRFGFCYDWSREFATIDPDYYKWTQWIFCKVYDAWFDPEEGSGRGRGRPIAELIEEFESGARTIRLNPQASEHSDEEKAQTWEAWADVDVRTRHRIIASYRLAYIGEQTVNWCPKLGTALANEEVIDGRSERGGFPVMRKPLRQWLFRITAYADRLLDDLPKMSWPESTRSQQTAWIGRSDGAEVKFNLDVNSWGSLRVFTTRPDTVFGATYMVVAPEHPLVEQVLTNPQPETDSGVIRAYVNEAKNRSDVERMENKEKTGVFTGVYAINPANNLRIPVWTADYVLTGYGTGAIMAVPGQDQRDWDFAEAFDLPIVRTVQPTDGFDGKAFTGAGPAINSGFLDGLEIDDAKSKIIDWLEEHDAGARKINFKLRDWLFSRQRYWGEPFPIVFDEFGDHHRVDDDALPVVLPEMADYQPVESDTPQPLLGKATDWVSTTAGDAHVPGLDPSAPVTRETNTMPGWAGSCWYFLRYTDPKCDTAFASNQAERYWMLSGKSGVSIEEADKYGTFMPDLHHIGGVDLYIGGAEHAVLHLLYARFWHKVLFDLGEVTTPEPFGKLFHQGLITSYAYQRPDKTLVPVDEVDERDDGTFIERATGEEVVQITAKMSKSLKNVVNPDDIIAEFGADTFRLYEMYMGPLEASKPWDTRAIGGMYRFLQRAWRIAVDEESGELRLASDSSDDIEKLLHRTIAKVGDDIDNLRFNTAIASMIEFVNAATGKDGGASQITRDQLERFARTLAPFAPHMAEELWNKLGEDGLVSDASWPSYDNAMLTDDEIEVPVQILGKVRAKIMVPAGADAKQMEAIALADDKVKSLIEGKTVRKVIAVPGRMVNIVAN